MICKYKLTKLNRPKYFLYTNNLIKHQINNLIKRQLFIYAQLND